MANNGFIQLHRQLLEWEWYTDQKTFKLFLHCLLRANHKEHNWRGNIIKRGQFITSLQNLSIETGLSVKQVRTALDNLVKTKEVGKQTTSQNTIITVLSYDKYQQVGKQTDTEKTNEGQTKGKQRATNNNDNKENNDIDARKLAFKDLIQKFIDENPNKYPKQLYKDFYYYWSEHGVNDRKMRFEKQTSFDVGRRLSTWYKNDLNGEYKKQEKVIVDPKEYFKSYFEGIE